MKIISYGSLSLLYSISTLSFIARISLIQFLRFLWPSIDVRIFFYFYVLFPLLCTSVGVLIDFDRVKQYALTEGSTARECQASSASTSTLSTPNQCTQAVHHISDDISTYRFQTSPPMSLSALVLRTLYGVD